MNTPTNNPQSSELLSRPDQLSAPKPEPSKPWRGVFFGGPQADQDHDGDEIPSWVVYVGDADAGPVGTVYTCHSYAYAASLARSMARERNLELIDEAMPA